MALPKIKHTMYSHTLHSNGKKVKFRPFTNQEQKVLLLAKDSENSEKAKEDMVNAVFQIIHNCTEGTVDAYDLPTFDIEDLFLRIRSKSVGEIVSVKYRYDYLDDEGAKQSKFITANINLDEVKIKTKEGHENKIQLTSEIGLVMKYPTFKVAQECNTDDEAAIACIDYIYDKDEIYSVADQTKKELEDFYNDIDAGGMMKISKFFETMPKLSHSVDIDLGNGKTETVLFEGIESFFT